MLSGGAVINLGLPKGEARGKYPVAVRRKSLSKNRGQRPQFSRVIGLALKQFVKITSGIILQLHRIFGSFAVQRLVEKGLDLLIIESIPFEVSVRLADVRRASEINIHRLA